jgi:NodT family efflux transporter outer membrane factor (OMF) lipoprotein
MKNNVFVIFLIMVTYISGCKVPKISWVSEKRNLPNAYSFAFQDTSQNIAKISWKQFFNDPYLISLIDSALANNQELKIFDQEIEILRYEIQEKKAEYLPFVNIQGETSVDKVGRFTRYGALEHNLEIDHEKPFPEPFSDFQVRFAASWELDVWKKLRNAKEAARLRFLASQSGKNFLITHLVAEIASTYYELQALDNLLQIIQNNTEIQANVLKIIQQEKNAGKVTQLAVNRFEAQLLNTQKRQYEIQQKIIEAENRLNFLVGRYPSPILRNSLNFLIMPIDTVIGTGLPSQLLENRPDIQQAEWELQAAKVDIAVARANFLPSFSLKSDLGLQAFSPKYFLHPESILLNLLGDFMAPLVNKNALYAKLKITNAKQKQAVVQFEQKLLNAYLEVSNWLNKIDNYHKAFALKKREVDILTQSINISNNLYNSGRADYMEVLLTQREALESTLELIEIKLVQMESKIQLYRALGGGWR